MRAFRPASLITISLLIVFSLPAVIEAKDTWTQVRSKNFNLIGNASEKDIRRVATKLEQFRETIRQILRRANFSTSVPTTVVVFKSQSSYDEFRPRRADGKPDKGIAGYFQPGQDVNYITLSSDGDDRSTYGVIFHEFVHNIIDINFGKTNVPPWFNEGLAEYYETFEIKDDQVVKLGLPNENHLTLLQQSSLIPFDTFFAIDNYSLHQNGNHSRSIFYAQSWALIHYLIQNGKTEGLNTLLTSVVNGDTAEDALKKAFGMDARQLEKELKSYVSKRRFAYHELTFKDKLMFDNSMAISKLGEAESNAFLGDLLYHTNRADDAEPYLAEAIRLDPSSGMANVAMGLIRLKADKLDDARRYLETAIAADQRNHLAYFNYAYLLTRSYYGPGNRISSIDRADADKMRLALKKAIEIDPSFTESYELLAFINLVTNEQLDESLVLLRLALKVQPGNQRYALRMGDIYLHQGKYDEAAAIAQQIAATSDDPETRARAGILLENLGRRKEFEKRRAEIEKRNAEALNMTGGSGGDIGSTDEDPDDPEVILRSVNNALRKPADGEVRVIGSVQKIDCTKRPLVYTVKTAAETFTLTSVDFQSLALQAFTRDADDVQVGCEANISAINAIITYIPKPAPRSTARGEIVAIEFVGKDFRFVEQRPERKPVLQRGGPSPVDKTALNRALNRQLPKLNEGELIEIGYLDRIECTGEGSFYNIRTPARTYRLLNSGDYELPVMIFVQEILNLKFGCGLEPVEYPVVFIYRPTPDGGKRGDGELRSITFVPKDFELERKP